jgi:leucine dehydrogenase
VTAYGVYMGMKASAKEKFGSDSLAGKTVAVQGCGHVGYYLSRYLHEEGARLIVTDIDKEKVRQAVEEFRARAVGLDEIYGVQAEVFAPCALGAVLNDATIPQLKVQIVAGGANNQLAEERHGDLLAERGILYAPDYVLNAGGLINVNSELEGWSAERAKRKAGEIYDTILRLFEVAKEEGIPTYRAADRLAERRIEAVGKLKRTWV